MNKDSLSPLHKIVETTLKNEAKEIEDASRRVGPSVVETAEIILNHEGKVVICGLGKSGLIGQKIVATLCSTGIQAVFLHAAEALHGDLGIYHPGDPTILISKSGATEELRRLIPRLRDFNSPLIGLVGNVHSPVSNEVDIVLDASVSTEADPLGVVPTSSTTLTLAIGDALTSVLMAMREFKHEDFARLHPGGELGKQLRLRIQDVMHSLDEAVTVPLDQNFFEMTKLMTDKPLGAALVLDDEKHLLGIITDGDIRRCLAMNGNFNSMKLTDIMNKDPVSVPVQLSMDEAMKLMEDRPSQISVLPVMDLSRNVCVGLLRLHDIYQSKLY
ncbi:MAG: KpsF/GutQ family sugar-phosphate isomerase [Candidatus Neomarinimicrobiota bacterium]|nr:KpsF/GutQ family sugar-phosphate isomerase [Candidatus Neomarinimicrobiota bacterium]